MTIDIQVLLVAKLQGLALSIEADTIVTGELVLAGTSRPGSNGVLGCEQRHRSEHALLRSDIRLGREERSNGAHDDVERADLGRGDTELRASANHGWTQVKRVRRWRHELFVDCDQSFDTLEELVSVKVLLSAGRWIAHTGSSILAADLRMRSMFLSGRNKTIVNSVIASTNEVGSQQWACMPSCPRKDQFRSEARRWQGRDSADRKA